MDTGSSLKWLWTGSLNSCDKTRNIGHWSCLQFDQAFDYLGNLKVIRTEAAVYKYLSMPLTVKVTLSAACGGIIVVVWLE